MRNPDLIPFTLPHGYRDREGVLHREGLLRAATASDEMRALGDFRVFFWPGAFFAVLLSRVVSRLGSLERIDAGVMQALGEDDRVHLELAYRKANGYPAE